MPIEFRCSQCQRLLRVPDQTAGAQARCPQCSYVQMVPAASSGSSPSVFDGLDTGQPASQPSNSSSSPFAGSGSSQAGSPNPFAQVPQQNPYSDNPYESPYAAGYRAAPSTRDDALAKVMAPAIIQIVMGVLAVLAIGFVGLMALIEAEMNGITEDAILTLLIFGFSLLVQLIVIAGSIRMLALKNHGLALTAAILNLICGLCNIITLAIGIWSLVVLCDSNVKSHFR